MSLTVCYVPYVPSSEEERKHGNHEQGSLTLYTLLVHVEKSETHLRKWDKGEKGNIQYNNHNHMHYNVLGDVEIHYSLPVMFNMFRVVKRRENMAVMSKDHRHGTHCWCMWKRWRLT